jgi:hypothetical protein
MASAGGSFGYVADSAATPSLAAFIGGVQSRHVNSDGLAWDP